MATTKGTPTCAQDLWDAAAPMIAVTERHPFLVAMVDGTLAASNFQYYVVQDALYLHEFAACLRSLGAAANTTVSARLVAFADGAEEAELALHRSFFADWSIDTADAVVMPHTLLYTSYMRRIVATRPWAEGLAVLLPCFWVYMHVGDQMLALRKQLGDTVQRSKQFDAWIDMYGGDDFAKEVKEYIEIVDAACATADAETLRRMQEHFNMSCRLEHMVRWMLVWTCYVIFLQPSLIDLVLGPGTKRNAVAE